MARGAEVVLVRRFAESLDATPDWFWGGEQRHMEALEAYELDVLIGSLEAQTPWSKKVWIDTVLLRRVDSRGYCAG